MILIRGLVKYFSQGGAVEIKRYIGSTYCSKILKNRIYNAFIILYAWNPDIIHYAYHYVLDGVIRITILLFIMMGQTVSKFVLLKVPLLIIV